MGAAITICDPHRAIVDRPAPAARRSASSRPDIRAGMAMLIAALCADGVTEIGNIRQIDRGYERIDERLRELGARIERVGRRAVAAVSSADARPADTTRADGLPDPQRNARLPARRDARAARDDRPDPRRVRAAPATARSTPRRSSTSGRSSGARSPAARPAYRMFDEQGNVLVLRSDMTVPIARVVATRYAHAEPPLRFCYFAHAYRGVRPQRGQSREFLQAGSS